MPGFISRFVSAPDALRLHARDYQQADGGTTGGLTVVCLPGLARTSADFHVLATALLESGVAARVLVIDYRGRGLSARDPNPDRYDLPIESADLLAVLAALEIGAAVFVGTSRGGLHTLMLGAVRPTILQGVVLNDIGPVIEPRGLARIRGYIGKLPEPKSWPDAIDLLKHLASAHFTALEEQDWETFARTTFEERDGRFVPLYDPALMHNLAKLDLDAVPVLWPQFEGLRHVPVLVVRGENSDLLSAATVTEMTKRHPDCAAVTVPGQGHAPLLIDTPTTRRICQFVERCGFNLHSTAAAQRGLSLLL
ncbi:alpha/beta fold hydrolase [Lichenihabitans psoromatis]|uniref:alpha/beta fold hydrolase n=1 Tax=Lichenihabitans psoromatis TaxID=2528642 RepID=UPI001035720D|nr:alpha/beta hydrolase [Lichenihabitans psoromatis]